MNNVLATAANVITVATSIVASGIVAVVFWLVVCEYFLRLNTLPGIFLAAIFLWLWHLGGYIISGYLMIRATREKS